MTVLDKTTDPYVARFESCSHCGRPIYAIEDFVEMRLNYPNSTLASKIEVTLVGTAPYHKRCFVDMAGEQYLVKIWDIKESLCTKCHRRQERCGPHGSHTGLCTDCDRQ